MELKEIFDRVLIDSGQFLITTEDIEMNSSTMLILVRSVLAIYGQYSPIIKWFNIEIQGATRAHTFTESGLDADGNEIGIPKFISEVVPVEVLGTYTYYLWDNTRYTSQELIDLKPYPFRYNSPTLYVPGLARYDIYAGFTHKIRTVVEDSKTHHYFDTITDEDDTFFKLLTARFLKGLGRSRRAFTLNELPIVSDASELVTEGDSLEEKAMEELTEAKSAWWMGWT
ncbi:MAG: hypothetical protein ACW991_02900 [Candidatus Hodarchaeales archaeon]|jgi:hypothetical protein